MRLASRKVEYMPDDSLAAWIDRYVRLAVTGVRSEAVTQKLVLHLQRFRAFFMQAYGHDRLSACVKRDVATWRQQLQDQGLAAATINNHLASLSAFATWVQAQAPRVFPNGDPTKGVGELPLPPLEPRALTDRQIQSLKNLCDRLVPFYRLKGRRWSQTDESAPLRVNARPWRDRAIVYVLLSTGLRREELVRLNVDQLDPDTPSELRQAHKGRITEVRGKGKTQREVFLSHDARLALADYLDKERPQDVTSEDTVSLFLSAANVPSRARDGRLSPRSVNLILDQIGRWHDAELDDPQRHISPLRPHDLRHTFAFQLARATKADVYELERRLGHRSQRYIQRYTNPPTDVAAQYVEEF
jgi:integrase